MFAGLLLVTEHNMKLYVYDHCPFCVRARMAAGLFAPDTEEVVLANDDEAAPVAMIGAKQVPILEKDDGTFMGESLDIVGYLAQGRLKEDASPKLQAWLDKVGEYGNRLTHPRVGKIGLAEFAEPSAVAYFTAKKEKSIGSFNTHLKRTGEYLTRIGGDLNALDTLMADEAWDDTVGMKDILLFPVLRTLTVVRGIEWPLRIAEYLQRVSEQTGVDLYFDRAL